MKNNRLGSNSPQCITVQQQSVAICHREGKLIYRRKDLSIAKYFSLKMRTRASGTSRDVEFVSGIKNCDGILG